MTVRVTPRALCGTVKAPPSKSAAHRALIAAALSGESAIHGIVPSEDMEATLRVLYGLGVDYTREGDTVTFHGMRREHEGVVDCGESGSTLRFFVPIFAALGKTVTFCGRGRLPERPLTTYEQCLPLHGVPLTKPSSAGAIVTASGKLRGGRFEVAGDVSSQFITGLLFALPLLSEDSEIVLTSPLQSAGYVDMTLEILALAGVTIARTADGFLIPRNQHYRLFEHTVEGDWSQAAFLLTAGAIGGDVTVTGLRADSVQGDKEIVKILCDMGADIVWEKDGLRARKSELRARETDVSNIPDLVPILSVAASCADGTSRLFNAARLRIKESDRLATTAAMITALGGKITEYEDTLLITGAPLTGGAVDGANDHRIVMSAAIAAATATGQVEITDAHSVCKSWPSFFEDYTVIGGAVNEF